MTLPYKRILTLFMMLAMSFGFFHLFIPSDAFPYDFERLHIFLFNLCSGGSLILFYTRQDLPPGPKIPAFLALSLTFAFSAFLGFYLPAMICAFLLGLLVESERIRMFSFFPMDFFRHRVPVSQKFHQASLLCLSMGLFISVPVIFNETYGNWISMEKLTLNTFFLGFSFPVSLITMSIMFSLVGDNGGRITRILKDIGFWSINLGVIFFFVFILFEWPSLQLFISLVLFGAVLLIFILFLQDHRQTQKKAFLTSGMLFLVFTGISGIAYILLEMSPFYNHQTSAIILKMHSFSALYGWNLCGLVVIMRYKDFPIQLHSRSVICFHWLIVLILAPLGYCFPLAAVLATTGYILLLEILFFFAKSQTESEKERVLSQETEVP